MNLIDPHDVRRVALVGAGTIGSSWATFFLSRGMDVTVSDPSPTGEQFVSRFVNEAWPAMKRLGLADGADPARWHFCTDPAEAVREAQFVQESAPERFEIKSALYAQIDRVLPPDTVVSTSTSGLSISAMQEGIAGAHRYVVGHPFNPPHLIPLVEVVGGKKTDPAVIDWTLQFYNHCGKRAIRINKEVPGHLANRLQVALWREAVHAVDQGVASVEDVDAAVVYSIGLRWAMMGPHMSLHLAGGAGGLRHQIEHIGPGIQKWWEDLGEPRLTPQVNEKLIAGVEQEASGRSIAELESQRDQVLLELLEAFQRSGRL